MGDQRHGSGDTYGNRKYFPSSTAHWGPRLTQGVARAIRPDDIQCELIKIAHLVASIRLATTVCDAAWQHTREGWDAKKAEQAPSTLPLPQCSNPVTVSPGKVIG